MNKRLWVLLAAVMLFLCSFASAGAVFADEDIEDTVEIPQTEWEKIKEILDKLAEAETEEEIIDIQKNIFEQVFDWIEEKFPILSIFLTPLNIFLIIFVYKRLSKYVLGVLVKNRESVKTSNDAIQKVGDTFAETSEKIKGIEGLATETEKQAARARLFSECGLKMIKLLVERSNLDEESKKEARRMLNEALAENDLIGE